MRGRRLNSWNDYQKLLKWLSKAIIVINWFSHGAQAGIILEKYINKCKCIKQSY